MPKNKNNEEDDKGGRGRGGDDSGGNGHRKFEHDKGNAAHIEIEERRFRGGLPPTPELYARAREQWNRLPGAVVRSPQNPVTGKPPVDPKDQAAEPGADDDNRGDS